jgi:hypothetical protein
LQVIVGSSLEIDCENVDGGGPMAKACQRHFTVQVTSRLGQRELSRGEAALTLRGVIGGKGVAESAGVIVRLGTVGSEPPERDFGYQQAGLGYQLQGLGFSIAAFCIGRHAMI